MARPLRAFVFDAYGTLFDVHSIAQLAEAFAPGQGAVLSQIWRTKQLEYTWLQSLMISATQPRDDFAALTAHALDYAIAQLMVPLTVAERKALLDGYLHLAPLPRWILSNGTLAMLERLVRSSVLAADIDGVISADAAGIYKPSPRVYQLAVDRLRLEPADIAFVSANGWDAAGAKAFGFASFWINRSGYPVERHAPEPDFIVGSLANVAAMV